MRNTCITDLIFQADKFRTHLLSTLNSSPSDDSALNSFITKQTIQNLSKIYPKIDNLRPKIEALVEPPSRAQSSDLGEDNEAMASDLVSKRVTYSQIESMLVDENAIQVVEGNEGEGKTVLVKGVMPYIDYFMFDKVIEDFEINVSLAEVRFLFFQGVYSVVLGFEKSSHVETIKKEIYRGTFKFVFKPDHALLHVRIAPKSTRAPKLSLRDEMIEIKQQLEGEKPEAFQYYSSNFVACVLRKMSKSFVPRLTMFLSKHNITHKLGVLCTFRNHQFCLLFLNCIEDAENVCILLKKIRNMQFPVKAHIHQMSCRRRTQKKKNFFYKLFRDEREQVAQRKEGKSQQKTRK